MKTLTLFIFIALFFFSCKKDEEQTSSFDELGKKELEQKEKELDLPEKVLEAKDTLKSQAKYNWEGEYFYNTNSDGHNFEYKLIITKNPNGIYKANLNYSGYQTYQPINCIVEVIENKVNIYFSEYSEKIKVKLFSVNDLLLTLENNGKEIITYWQKAAFSDNQINGVSFKKIPNNSFEFMSREIVFGSNSDNFLNLYSEFKMNNELSSDGETGASYTLKPKDCEINFDVYFDHSGLNRFKMQSNCSSSQDERTINSIIKQFKHIPSKVADDDEEMGDIVEIYKKGKLTATEFIGGFYQLTIEDSK